MNARKPKFLTRHNAASPREFEYYASGIPMRNLCRMLGRHERTVKRWLNGETVIPPWAIAVLRLNRLENQLIHDQMGFTDIERHKQATAPAPKLSKRPPANEAVYTAQPHRDEPADDHRDRRPSLGR